MKLLIIGPTGPTGKEIVKQALAQGHTVTAFVRNPAAASFAPPVRKAAGNVLDRDSLKRALDGQEGVISSLGSRPTGPFKEIMLLSEGTGHLVAAMQELAVSRLVCITGIGAGESKGHGPWYFNRLIQPLVLRGVYHDKDRQEAVVRASGLDWTLVRPAILTNAAARGTAAVHALTELTKAKVSTIGRADVAAWCLRELTDGRYRQQAPVITY